MNSKKGPWTVKDSKTIYKNPWINVREDSVIKPDGREGVFGIVEMKPGVSVLPLDNEGNIYLTKEYHYAIGRETIEAVSGGIDKDEDKLDAAKRELREEVGIVAKKWIYLGFINPFTAVIASPNHIYLAKELQFSKANPEGTERITIIKVSMGQAIQWVMGSKILLRGFPRSLLRVL